MDLEWNGRTTAEHLEKHGVSVQEATTLFGDLLALTFIDSEHSATEERLLTFGVLADGRPVVVSHVERGGSIRINSARLMTPQERRQHEHC